MRAIKIIICKVEVALNYKIEPTKLLAVLPLHIYYNTEHKICQVFFKIF